MRIKYISQSKFPWKEGLVFFLFFLFSFSFFYKVDGTKVPHYIIPVFAESELSAQSVEAPLNLIFEDGSIMIYKGKSAGFLTGGKYKIEYDSKEKGLVEVTEVTDYWTKAKVLEKKEPLETKLGKTIQLSLVEKPVEKAEKPKEPPKEKPKKEEKPKEEKPKKEKPPKEEKPKEPPEEKPKPKEEPKPIAREMVVSGALSDLLEGKGILGVQVYNTDFSNNSNNNNNTLTTIEGGYGIDKDTGIGFSALSASGLSAAIVFGIQQIKLQPNTPYNLAVYLGGYNWRVRWYNLNTSWYRKFNGLVFGGGINSNTSKFFTLYGQLFALNADNKFYYRYEVGGDYLVTENLALNIAVKGFLDYDDSEFHYGAKLKF